MKYTLYKEAAKRHIQTCRLLKANLPTDTRRANILANMFYLSGYVVECTVYFAFFDSISNPLKTINLRLQTGQSCFRETEDVRKLDSNNNADSNITWKKNLDGHFQFVNNPTEKKDLLDYLSKNYKIIETTPILKDLINQKTNREDDLTELFKKWNPDKRYIVLEMQGCVSETNILSLIDKVETINKNLIP
jgi:hypothetical protein